MVKRTWSSLERFEPLLVILLLTAVFVARIPQVMFHPDESHWIYSSVVFEKLVKMQWSSPVWQESYWTLTQPPLARYVIGLGRRLGGYTVVNNPWRFYLDWETNLANGAMPSAGLLWWSRLPMAVLAALSCWALYLLLRRCCGRLAGWVWVTDCLLSVYLLHTLGKAMGEAPLVAAVVGASWAAERALHSRSPHRGLFWWTVFGVLAGTAGAAKLNGLILAAAGSLLIVVWALRLGRRRIGYAVAGCLVVLGTTAATFVAWNPFLYSDPLAGTQKMLAQRQSEMSQQVIDNPSETLPVGWQGRLRIAANVTSVDAPLPWPALVPLHLFLSAAGLLQLLRRSHNWLAGVQMEPGALVILVVWGVASAPALLSQLDWQRYFLLPQLLNMLCMAAGFEYLAVATGRRWQQMRRPA